MSKLSEALAGLQESRKTTPALLDWWASLDAEDQATAWAAIESNEIKNYRLYDIFRGVGLRCSKDTFVAFRRGVLEGNFTKEDLNV